MKTGDTVIWKRKRKRGYGPADQIMGRVIGVNTTAGVAIITCQHGNSLRLVDEMVKLENLEVVK